MDKNPRFAQAFPSRDTLLAQERLSSRSSLITSTCGNLRDRSLRDGFETFLCVPSVVGLCPRKDTEIPLQHEPVEAWLRLALHAGRAQGRSLVSESMLVSKLVSIPVGPRNLDLLYQRRTLTEMK